MGVQAYPDNSGIGNMAIELKEVADLDGLSSPVVTADRPREGELQGLSVEGA